MCSVLFSILYPGTSLACGFVAAVTGPSQWLPNEKLIFSIAKHGEVQLTGLHRASGEQNVTSHGFTFNIQFSRCFLTPDTTYNQPSVEILVHHLVD
jgi:hypothetical protein